MNIAIIGAGAMGSLFGARLAHHQHTVLLVDTWKEHVEAIRRHGLRVDDPGHPSMIRLHAVTDASGHPPVDLMILLVKAHCLAEALRSNVGLVGSETAVVTLANGLGTGEAVAQIVGAGCTVLGATAVGAILLAPGHVRYTVPGETYVGPVAGPVTPEMTRIGAVLRDAGFPTVVTEHIAEYVWNKLLLNVGYNALGALTGRPNGEIAADPEGRQLIASLVGEAASLARRLGIHLHHQDPVAYCLECGQGPIAPYPSSMLQDVLRGRRTEIDFLNGAVVHMAASLGAETPVNAAVTALVHLLQTRGREVRTSSLFERQPAAWI